jgi:plasmid stabilization system protein ParE
MKVEWSPSAVLDLNRFRLFLRDRHPRIADLAARELGNKVEILADFPFLGRLVPEQPQYRGLLVTTLNTKYIVQYSIEEEAVMILRVFHGRERREEEI